MTGEYRKGLVYVQGRYAGIIEENDEGYAFQYEEEYLNHEQALPISITMPLQKAPFQSNVLFPFFDGLIPEGWLLGVVNRNWKIDPKDRFGLLLAVCRDCIGDVIVKSEGKR